MEPTHGNPEQVDVVLDATGVGVWSWDVRANVIRWSGAIYRLFGIQPADFNVSLDAYRALLHPDDRAVVERAIESALARAAATGSSADYHVEHRILRADGETRWLEGRGLVTVDAHGNPVSMAGSVLDITAHKEALLALRRTEEQLRLYNELASDYVYVAEVRDSNLSPPSIVAGSLERTTGLSPEQVGERGGWLAVIHADDRAAAASILAETEAGRAVVAEYRIVDSQGEIRWLRDRLRPVLDPESGKLTRVIGAVQDMTEQRRLAEQLMRASKLEALARMAGGVAHDFNNLLTIMHGSVDLLEAEQRDVGGETREALDDIRTATHRATELTRSLLAFGRKQRTSQRVISLADLVRETTPMLARALGERVQVEVRETRDPRVSVDVGQLQLVLLNLAVNARDAIPDGGTITIVCDERDFVAQDPARPQELAPGRYAVLEIIDRGVGMDAEVMRHLFEPFFTTKGGLGSGLGLATSHGIVRQLAGGMSVRSAPGRGTTVRVVLPISEHDTTPRAVTEVRSSVGGSERLLVVEDEPALRRVAVRVLRDLGYHVLDVGSAEEALGLPGSVLERLDLLVSDVMLPGMNGVQLAARLRASFGLPALLVSGFIDEDAQRALLEGSDVAFLPKPYTRDGLARRVREAIPAKPKPGPAWPPRSLAGR